MSTRSNRRGFLGRCGATGLAFTFLSEGRTADAQPRERQAFYCNIRNTITNDLVIKIVGEYHEWAGTVRAGQTVENVPLSEGERVAVAWDDLAGGQIAVYGKVVINRRLTIIFRPDKVETEPLIGQ